MAGVEVTKVELRGRSSAPEGSVEPLVARRANTDSPFTWSPTATLGRRKLLAWVAAAVATGVLAPVVTTGRARAAAPAALDEHHLATYRALIDTVGAVPGTLVLSGTSADAAARLHRAYSTAGREWRARAFTALEVLDDPQGGAFATMEPVGRLARVRDLLGSSPSAFEDDDNPGLRAVSLAAAPYHSPGFRWSSSAAHLWARTLLNLPPSFSPAP